MHQGNFSSSRQKDSFSLYPSLPLSPPPSFPPPLPPRPLLPPSLPFSLFPSVALAPGWMFLFFFPPSCLLSSLPTSFGCWLRGLPLSQGKGSLRDRAPLPRRTGCLSEPRSESVGVTKEKGASTWEERSFKGRRARERAGEWGLGGWRRWRRTRVAPRGGWTQLPISWVHRPPSTARLQPEARVQGGPLAAARVGQGAGVIKAAQSLPVFRSTSLPRSRGDRERPERATALSCLPFGSPGTCAPLRRGHHPHHTPTTLNLPTSRPLCSSLRAKPGGNFHPRACAFLLPGSALFN